MTTEWENFEKHHGSKDDTIDIFRFLICYIFYSIFINSNHDKEENNTIIANQITFFNNILFQDAFSINIEKNYVIVKSKKQNYISIDLKNLQIIKSQLIKLNNDWNLSESFNDETESISPLIFSLFYEFTFTLNNRFSFKRKNQGIYFTPITIAYDLSIRTIHSYFHIIKPKDPDSLVIFDPSCGSGNFLISSLNILAKINSSKKVSKHKNSLEIFTQKAGIVKKNLVGYDIDDLSISICKIRIFFYLLSDINDLNYLIKHIKNKSVHFNNLKKIDVIKAGISPKSFHNKKLVIVGNPPWGKIKLNQKEQCLFTIQSGPPDLYKLFLERILDIKPSPELISLITPSTWLEIPSTRLLRSTFMKKYKFILKSKLDKHQIMVGANMIKFIAVNKNTRYSDQNQFYEINSKDVILAKVYQTNLKLKDIVDATIGYQLYHNSMHNLEEIKNKVFHSNKAINPLWKPEIVSRDLILFNIKRNNSNYVNSKAKFFRIPHEKFIKSKKILLREIPSKSGFIVARSNNHDHFFPKSIISLIIKVNTEYKDDENLLSLVIAYLSSKLCLFEFKSSNNKSNQDLFPRISLKTLYNLNFNTKLIDTNLVSIIQKLEYFANKIGDPDNYQNKKKIIQWRNQFQKTFAELDATIFKSYNITKEKEVKFILAFLDIPLDETNLILSHFIHHNR